MEAKIMSVTAVVLINARGASLNSLAESLAEVPGVMEVFSVAGRYDLVAIVRAARNEDLPDIVSGQMRSVADEFASETLIAFRVYRRADIEAGFSLGVED
jgi:DNA-binding Lrp family transcriptional regulator